MWAGGKESFPQETVFDLRAEGWVGINQAKNQEEENEAKNQEEENVAVGVGWGRDVQKP